MWEGVLRCVEVWRLEVLRSGGWRCGGVCVCVRVRACVCACACFSVINGCH